jgi:hypothetical protein
MLTAAKLFGAAATLAKPFSPELLLSEVDQVLAESGPGRARRDLYSRQPRHGLDSIIAGFSHSSASAWTASSNYHQGQRCWGGSTTT